MEEIRRTEDGLIEDAAGDPDRAAQDIPRSHRRPGPELYTVTRLDDGERARRAGRPPNVEPPGWKEILLRVYRGISDDRILANAAAVTFYALLALFPAIAALVSVYGIFADPGMIEQQLDSLSMILPGGALEVIRGQLHRLVAQPSGTLSVSFVLGLIISLWSANGAIKAMFDALNVVYEEREDRGFFKLNAVTLAFTVTMIALVLMALGAIVVIPVALDYLPGFVGFVLDIARWPVMLVLVALALACIYRFGPSRNEAEWRWVTWGSGFAALTWLGFSAIFSFYAGHFGNFNATYGSLGAVIGFMTWMWLSVAVILIGGKLDAEIERPAERGSASPRA